MLDKPSFPYGTGFRSLTREVAEPVPLPVCGELPPWLRGTLLRTGPSKFEVGEQQLQSLVRRARDAASLRLRRRPRDLRQPLPQEQCVLRGGEDRQDRLRRVRHRSLPHSVRARRRDVRSQAHSQLQRQCPDDGRRDDRAHRDHASGSLRSQDARNAWRVRLHAAFARSNLNRASPLRRRAHAPLQLHGRVRYAEPLPPVQRGR